jgi:transposase-like protein
MPGRVSESLRQTIYCMYNRLGYSIRKIANETQLDRKVVRRWIERPNSRDKARNCLNLSDRRQQMLKRSLKINNSIRKTAIENSISYSSVRKYCRRTASNKTGLFPYKPIKKLRMVSKHVEKRTKFVNRRRLTYAKLKKTIFADEKPFMLGTIPNKQNCRFWNEHGQVYEREFIVDKNPTTIHCFAAISWYKKSKLRWYLREKSIVRGMFI